jgi:hypothetical protein
MMQVVCWQPIYTRELCGLTAWQPHWYLNSHGLQMLPTGIRWHSLGHSTSVTDVHSLSFVRQELIWKSRGHTDLSPDETWIAISNQHNGIDVYKIPGAIWLKSYHFKIRDHIILPVYWIDHGLQLMAGSDCGTVCLWNVKNDAQLPSLLHGESHHHCWLVLKLKLCFAMRKFYCLCIDSKRLYIVFMVSIWCNRWQAYYDFTMHTCRFATCTAEHGPRTTIHLFETKELRDTGGIRSLHTACKLVSYTKTCPKRL